MCDASHNIFSRYCELWRVGKHERWHLLSHMEKSALPLEPEFVRLFSTIKRPPFKVLAKVYEVANFLNFKDLAIDVTKFLSIIIREASKTKSDQDVFNVIGNTPNSMWRKMPEVLMEVGDLISGK